MSAYYVIFDRPADIESLHIAFVDEPHDPYVLEAILEHVRPLSPTATIRVSIDAATMTGSVAADSFVDAAVFHLTADTDPDMQACRVCGCSDLDCSGCQAATGEPCSWIDDESLSGRICSRCFVEDGVRVS